MLSSLIKRTAESTSTTQVHLLIAFIVLVSVGSSICGALYLIRCRNNRLQLPTHESRHKSLTVTAVPYSKRFSTSSSFYEKSSPISPTSPVPEIRITFPEEEGPDGRRKSGRVVIVQVGEAGAAFVRDIPAGQLEREQEEALPKYTDKKTKEFSSVDLDNVGGLKEKYDWV